jgi:hypothetical protein
MFPQKCGPFVGLNHYLHHLYHQQRFSASNCSSSILFLSESSSLPHSSPSLLASPFTSYGGVYFCLPTFLFPLIFALKNSHDTCHYSERSTGTASLILLTLWLLSIFALYKMYLLECCICFSCIGPYVLCNSFLSNTSRSCLRDWKSFQHSVTHATTVIIRV